MPQVVGTPHRQIEIPAGSILGFPDGIEARRLTVGVRFFSSRRAEMAARRNLNTLQQSSQKEDHGGNYQAAHDRPHSPDEKAANVVEVVLVTGRPFRAWYHDELRIHPDQHEIQQ